LLHLVGCLYYCIRGARSHKHQIHMLLLFSQMSIPALEPTRPSTQWVGTWSAFSGSEWPGREFDHLRPSNDCSLISPTSKISCLYKKHYFMNEVFSLTAQQKKIHHFHYIQLTAKAFHHSSFNISIYTEFTRSTYLTQMGT